MNVLLVALVGGYGTPNRSVAGYREYVAKDIRRVRFIKNAQRLGFTLQEIQDLLDLRVDQDAACDDVRRQAEAKIAEVTERVKALQKMRRTLQNLVRACETRSQTGECPILEALEESV